MIPNKYITIFVSVLLAITTIWVGVLTRNSVKTYRYIGQSVEQKHSINISGEGKVIAVPDVAKIQLGLQTEKKTVAEAQKENTAKMNAVIDKLKKDFKIDAKDIQTANYNIYPQYDRNNGKQTFRSYQVTQNVNVKIRNMDKISDILQVVGDAGLNQVGGLTFEVDEPEKIKQQARELAIKNAKEKADALAKIADVKLGKVISFSEYANDSSSRVYNDYAMKSATGMGGAEIAPAPAVEAGSTEIVITANVEYEIY
ncbi:MAG: SIMPL domain-containing protein [Patescibacteria group bacterium]